jgi:four helix bundle protein
VLKSQLWRALDSIALNIAEGSEKYSDLDFSHFLNISLTSLAESVACFDLALDEQYVT